MMKKHSIIAGAIGLLLVFSAQSNAQTALPQVLVINDNDLLQIIPKGIPVVGNVYAPALLLSSYIITKIGGVTGLANPTATIGTSAVNGSATTAMRSDAAPVIPQASSTTFGAMKVDGTTETASGGVVSTAPTTINGVSCTPGGMCTVSTAGASLVVGTTTVNNGTTLGLLYDNAGVLGNLATGNSGVLVTSAGGVPSISSTLPSGLTAPNLTVTSSFTATGLVTLADLATQATNTILGNATSGTASPTALAIGGCSSPSNALKWTTNTGFGCNTAITATTNANLTGPITSVGNATAIASQTGTGTKFVVDAGPTVSALTVTGSLTATGLVTNADLVNAATTVNGQICTLGSTCSVGGGITGFANPTGTIGTTAVNGVLTTAMRSDAAPAIPQASSSTFGAMKVDNTTQTASAGVVSTASTTINGTTCTPGGSCSVGGGVTGFANPSATIGTSAVNGSATTAMRSDAAPAIPQASSSTFGAMKVDNTTQTAASGVVSTANTTVNGTACTPGGSCSPQGAVTPLTTGTSVSFSAPRGIFVCTSTCTITMPVPSAGVEFCVRNGNNVATVITFAAIGSSAMYEKTTFLTYGTAGTGTAVSGGAAGDKLCLVGLDSTHYIVGSFNGTWTMS